MTGTIFTLRICVCVVCPCTCPCMMALSSCRTACLASAGCSGDSMSSTAFHTASTACWKTHTHVHTQVFDRRLHVLLDRNKRHPEQTHLLKFFRFGKITDVVHHANAVAQTAVRVELLKNIKAVTQCKTWWGGELKHVWVCMNMHRRSVSSTHLDDVSRNDKLGRFVVTLFARWPRGSQPKDPLHLVLETLLAWLFIHGPTWRRDRLHRLGLMAAWRKSNTHLGHFATCITVSLDYYNVKPNKGQINFSKCDLMWLAVRWMVTVKHFVCSTKPTAIVKSVGTELFKKMLHLYITVK